MWHNVHYIGCVFHCVLRRSGKIGERLKIDFVLQQSGKKEERLKKRFRQETRKEGKHLGREPQEEGIRLGIENLTKGTNWKKRLGSCIGTSADWTEARDRIIHRPRLTFSRESTLMFFVFAISCCRALVTTELSGNAKTMTGLNSEEVHERNTNSDHITHNQLVQVCLVCLCQWWIKIMLLFQTLACCHANSTCDAHRLPSRNWQHKGFAQSINHVTSWHTRQSCLYNIICVSAAYLSTDDKN